MGPRTFILRSFDSPVWRDAIIGGMERAQPEWLEIGAQLKPHADGAASEELGLAIFVGLSVDPLTVLPVIQKVYGGTTEQACSPTFEAELPRQGVSKYLQSIELGLRQARTVEELNLAASCRKGLRETREYAKRRGLMK